MFSFFKINDPSRVIALFFVLLLIRLPFYIHGLALTVPELNYFLIGEKLANGGTLFVTLWEDVSPFSAWTYKFLFYVFGKSVWGYHVLAFVLVVYQSILFNSITYVNKAYNENTYVPALVYGLLMSLSTDMYVLSPVLLATTFILLALNNIFRQAEFRMKAEEPILNIGVYLGIAALFYAPFGGFAIITLVVLALFSSTIGRRYLLIVFGFSLPLTLVGAYYYATGGLSDAWQILVSEFFHPDKEHYMPLLAVAFIAATPLFYLLISFFKTFQRNRFSNYQVRLVQLMFTWLLLSVIILLWADRGPAMIIILVPALAFFITHYYYLIRKRLHAELVFSVFAILIIGLNLALVFGWLNTDGIINQNGTIVQETEMHEIVAGKKIVVLGDSIELYHGASAATPFFDWQLSKAVLSAPDYYGNATVIYQGFVANTPEVIIDLENLLPKIEKRMPYIAENYRELRSGIYVLKHR